MFLSVSSPLDRWPSFITPHLGRHTRTFQHNVALRRIRGFAGWIAERISILQLIAVFSFVSWRLSVSRFCVRKGGRFANRPYNDLKCDIFYDGSSHGLAPPLPRERGPGGEVAKRRLDGRGKTVEEILARYFIPPCLRHEKKPHKAGNLSPLPSTLSPLLRGRGERSGPVVSTDVHAWPAAGLSRRRDGFCLS